MSTQKTITLPTTPDQLRSAIKKAIAHYQGSPVKNDNKLNEALAVALDFANYDQLSAAIKLLDEKDSLTAYPVDYDYSGEQYLIVKGVRIELGLVHDGVIDYTVAEREDRIDFLRQAIHEATISDEPRRLADIPLMQQDLDTLLASEDEYVLEAYGTNGFVAGDTDPEEFNAICDDIIAQAAAYYAKQIGELTKTGQRFTNATTYYGGDAVSEIYEHELVLIDEDFLSDDRLAIGMVATRYTGSVPEGFIVAYPGSNGEYVPVYLNNHPWFRVSFHEDRGDKHTLSYYCQAEDDDAAASLTLDVYHHAEIVHTTQVDLADVPEEFLR